MDGFARVPTPLILNFKGDFRKNFATLQKSLKEAGSNSVQITTKNIFSDEVNFQLAQAANQGRTAFGGFNVTRLNDVQFVLRKEF